MTVLPMTYSIPSIVQDEYDRINALAGAAGAAGMPPLFEVPWATNERNNYVVRASEVHANFRLSNGNFVGIWSPANGTAVDNLVIQNAEIVHSYKWAMRPYEWRSNITIQDVSILGVLGEHGIYPTMIGYGTSRFPIEGDALFLNRVRMEYVGSQALQITGPRHLAGHPPGTPNTGFPYADADTRGGNIHVRDNFYRMVCLWGGGPNFAGGPAYALSFREAKQNVVVEGCVLDNRQMLGRMRAWGGVLLQGSPDFKRSMHLERMIVLQPVARYTMGLFDYPHHLTLKNCAFFQDPTSNDPFIRINKPTGRVRITGCVGNVGVMVDGSLVGSIEDDIEL